MRKIYSYLLAVMAAIALAIPATAQNVTVSGQVTDATDGQPLIGGGCHALRRKRNHHRLRR